MNDNSIRGRLNKLSGDRFENWLEYSFGYYKQRGIALIEKNHEPMKVVKPIGGGKFIAHYEKKAQPDYTGILKGGRMIVFEAKYSSKDTIVQDRVQPHQAEYLDEYEHMGALCYILVCFASDNVYRVPWNVWKNMKQIYGRKYVREDELTPHRVMTTDGDLLKILDY